MKITSIHSNYITSREKTSNARRSNNQNTYLNNNSVSNAELSFKGKQYPSGSYEDDEIKAAKKYINQFGDDWKKAFKMENGKKFSDLYFEESFGLNHITSIIARPGTDDWQQAKKASREGIGWGTAGIWELINSPIIAAEAGIRKIADNNNINKKTERIARLIIDMKAEKEADAAKIAFANLEKNAKKIEYNYRLVSLRDEIKSGFLKQIENEKRGESYKIPNVIMIEDSIGDLGEGLIEYTRKNADTNYKFIPVQSNLNMQKDLRESLKIAKAEFDTTGRRSLIKVEDMTKMLNSEIATCSLKEWMKDIMTSCATEFKSTLIFTTKDSSEIISEALEPHRIGLKIINKLKNIR